MWKTLLLIFVVLLLVGTGAVYLGYRHITKTLPELTSLKDYEPLLVTQVYDRNGKKIGEFSNQRRVLIPYDKIPKNLVNAFLAAEDAQFFQHGGVNWVAMTRAFFANLRAGHTVQGGSTITQQVAKTLLLTAERTYDRKIREVILAHRMEENLSKEEILYLYLNQIYFGQGAYGVAMAAETYFRKPVDQLSLAEMAALGGLPKAPVAYSPVTNPTRAKERQVYVLGRMAENSFITKDQAKQAISEPLKVFVREDYQTYAPHFLETIRELLLTQIDEDTLLNKGLRIETSLDLDKQLAAQEAVLQGLKQLDKRQGYRGATENFTDPAAVGSFLLKTRNELIQDMEPSRSIQSNGQFIDYGPLNLQYDISKGLPFYLKEKQSAKGIVSKIDDETGLAYVRLAEVEGLIDMDSMQWARKPNPEKKYTQDLIKKPSQALKVGDIILVKIIGPHIEIPRLQKKTTIAATPDLTKFIHLELDQEPLAEAALLSFDQSNNDILAMVGGQNFEKSKYNRALQAARQTGSSFKAIVYSAALDRGYTPATPIMDAPIVYQDKNEDKNSGDEDDSQVDLKTWKPSNDTKSFGGDIILRNALVKSLNVPSVKIIEDISVPFALDYARHLGIISPLNPDFTLVLGSSSLTLYEMTKVFSQFGKGGRRMRPIIIHRVLDRNGLPLVENLGLDLRFDKELRPQEEAYEQRRQAYLAELKTQDPSHPAEIDKKKIEPHIFFQDPDQLVSPQTAYLMTTLLKAVVEDRHGTGGNARVLGREVAGKTGTTQNFIDAWFVGYSQQISTGVWVGFDHEKTLGKFEFGATAALPIWIDYMKTAHEGLPQMTFPVPEGIVFANIDGDTGELASASSKNIIRQAFLEGTEPQATRSRKEEDVDFYKQDLQE